ncbi:hypothetical protein FDA94_28810 [Herbidospora galbida]|uniref:Uncharacterized protein n=1 Tax=Herbidospora galbida TaxID=2575442 RepID=A0A4V5UYG7_9ACTN|nr:hypothetical protein [Herbidospora galbida]TKK84633.1 hypothetical protein FDA94_28810 [Herbidospora galbida]
MSDEKKKYTTVAGSEFDMAFTVVVRVRQTDVTGVDRPHYEIAQAALNHFKHARTLQVAARAGENMHHAGFYEIETVAVRAVQFLDLRRELREDGM